MKHYRFDSCSRRAFTRGIALPTAIFIIVVLAALGAFTINLSGVQQTTTTQALTAARVSLAARSGLEWAVHKAVAPGAAGGAGQPGTCNASTSFSPTGNGLTGTSLAVTCSYSTQSGGGATYHVYYLTSTASYGATGTPDYVERKIEATVCRSAGPTALEC